MLYEINSNKYRLNKKHIGKVVEIFAKVTKQKKDAEVSIAFVGTKIIRNLNKIYRKKDKVTDVLSFRETQTELFGNYVGEIFICYPQARLQAKENKHSLKKEIDFLLSHGLLHLIGFTHKSKKAEDEMIEMQEKILKKCNEVS